MKRKELAEKIYEVQRERGLVKNMTKEAWVKALLHGCGALKALTLVELQDWYENIKER